MQGARLHRLAQDGYGSDSVAAQDANIQPSRSHAVFQSVAIGSWQRLSTATSMTDRSVHDCHGFGL